MYSALGILYLVTYVSNKYILIQKKLHIIIMHYNYPWPGRESHVTKIFFVPDGSSLNLQDGYQKCTFYCNLVF